jgi:hypothetical protein
MIGGIFGTIGQKLGIGKEKYFLELDDAAGKSVENLKGAATKATKVAKEAASDLADKAQELAGDAQEFAGDAADKAQELAGGAADKAAEAADKAKEAIATGQSKVQTKAKSAGRFGKKAVADNTAVKQDAKKDAKSAPKGASRQKGKSKNAEPAINKKAADNKAAAKKAVAAAPAAPRDPEDIIRNAITAGTRPIDSSGNVIDAAQNFATDFLMPQTSGSRRRPGPSLSPFRSMAKAVNPRLKG